MKKKIILVIIILAIIGLTATGIILYQQDKQRKLDESIVTKIKNSYSPYVKTTKKKKIYQRKDEKLIEVGTISKNITIPLDKKEVKDKTDIYYQISNSNYLVDYEHLTKVEDYQLDNSLDHYLVTKKIKTNPTKLYQDNELVLEINTNLEFDCLLVDNNKYYVKYLDNIYYIQDSYTIEDINVETAKLSKISVLNFSDDISKEKVEEILKYLRENNYESISIEDFKFWVGANVELTDKKVLLISYKNWDEEKQAIMNKYNYRVNHNLETITFTTGDQQLKVGDKTYYKYEIYSTTTLNRVKDMLNGVKEVKVIPSRGGVAVLNYHFFYDDNGESCNESICISTTNFKKQLDYLKQNNYKVLTMQEFNDWMDGKIDVPQKSVLITIDDGAMGTYNHLPQILNEYQMPATLFLISGWWPISRYQSSPYLEIHSHTHDLHHNNYCDNNGCGYKTLKLSKEEIKTDLQNSISTIGTNLAFCYPFYQTNQNLVQAVKESGFKLGFVGGNKKATRNNNKYYIPRYVVYKNTSLESFIKMVS